MSLMLQEKHYPAISESKSKYKAFFGRPTISKDGKLYNGEQNLPDGTIIRYVNGYIDGNIYDSRGEVVYTYPAIEYDEGKEYWTKGHPNGFPAICQKLGFYEEYWADGRIVKISETVQLLDISFDDEDDDDDEEVSDKNESDEIESDEDDDDSSNPYENFDFSSWGIEYNPDNTIENALSFERNIPFRDRLFEIMQIKGIKKDTEVYKPVFMSEKAFNRIKNSKPNDSISLDNAIMVAFGLKLNFEQMVKFTNFAGKGFRNYGKRDEIVKKYFENKNYKIFELNTELEKNGERGFFEIKEK